VFITAGPIIKLCAEVEITDQNKTTLLLLCASLGIASHLPAVLQAGADPAYTDENGCTSLWLACEKEHDAAAAERESVVYWYSIQ
jgi:hypothetical protein